MRRALASVPVILCLAPIALPAQDAAFQRPSGWHVRPDRPDADASDVYFVDMPPGWHITTGPGVLLWRPESTSAGQYRVEMESYLFDPGERREAFGVFVGGEALDGGGGRYLCFLVREGGQFLVNLNDGVRTRELVGWTGHDAIASFAARPDDASTAKNVLAVEVGAEELAFFVNGTRVASLPRGDLPVEGVVGLRVDQELNLHVTRLDVAPAG
jgi:hypothetical protein